MGIFVIIYFISAIVFIISMLFESKEWMKFSILCWLISLGFLSVISKLKYIEEKVRLKT